jgi:hypothetical protein
MHSPFFFTFSYMIIHDMAYDDQADSSSVIKNGFGTAEEDTIHLSKRIPTGFLRI